MPHKYSCQSSTHRPFFIPFSWFCPSLCSFYNEQPTRTANTTLYTNHPSNSQHFFFFFGGGGGKCEDWSDSSNFVTGMSYIATNTRHPRGNCRKLRFPLSRITIESLTVTVMSLRTRAQGSDAARSVTHTMLAHKTRDWINRQSTRHAHVYYEVMLLTHKGRCGAQTLRIQPRCVNYCHFSREHLCKPQ